MPRSGAAAQSRLALGVLLGLLASAGLLSVLDGTGGLPAAPLRGPLLSDCDGAIDELVIHYVAEAAEIVAPAYCQFLPQLPADVTVHVLCPDREAFEDLLSRVGATRCTLSPIVVGHAITPWSRDRWLALAPARQAGQTTLLSPRAEQGADLWPARAGDQRTGDDLAAALGPPVISVRSNLFFDGGDFVADSRTAFVTPDVLRRNLQQTVRTPQELIEQLSAILQRKIVLLREAPDHHAGMYMMALGNRTVLVGDPAAAQGLLPELAQGRAAELCPDGGPDFSPATIARFDAVARQCQAAGYRVVRIPIVPGRDGRTYLTYLNAILDKRAGRRIVYMPVFACADALNHAAEQVWTSLGYEVRPVNCDACYPHFGSLRCLVNVLRRG